MKLVVLFFAVTSILAAPAIANAAETRSIEFPINGPNYFRDDFHEPRSGGTREHLGVDIVAGKMTPVVAAADGRIVFIASPQPSWGYAITLQDSDGYQYRYLHLNNDTPGTDDGRGGEANAYAPGIDIGTVVTKGQHLGWVGDSGNAESTVSHLHFELRGPNRVAINPYESLSGATGPYAPANYSANGQTSFPEHQSEGDLDAKEAEIIFKRNLVEGVTLEQVKEAHEYLTALGYYSGPITDRYDANTREAVRKFQAQQGLTPSGMIDGDTWSALVKTHRTLPKKAEPVAGPAQTSSQLSLGSQGETVSELQTRLKELGFYDYPSITGYFGPVTETAVKAFQSANGIESIGIVGPKTRAALEKETPAVAYSVTENLSSGDSAYIFTKTLSKGAYDKEVEELQRKLKSLGHFSYPEFTTFFGSATEAAVIAFQKANGIEPIGIVGPKTRSALNGS